MGKKIKHLYCRSKTRGRQSISVLAGNLLQLTLRKEVANSQIATNATWMKRRNPRNKQNPSRTTKYLMNLLSCLFYFFRFLVCIIHRFLMTKFVTSVSIKFFFLIIPLAVSLYMWTEVSSDTSASQPNPLDSSKQVHYNNNGVTLAVILALQRHLPSRRVFDCMLEFALVGFCASFAVYLWESTFYRHLSRLDQELVWNHLWLDSAPPLNDEKDLVALADSCDDDDDDNNVEDLEMPPIRKFTDHRSHIETREDDAMSSHNSGEPTNEKFEQRCGYHHRQGDVVDEEASILNNTSLKNTSDTSTLFPLCGHVLPYQPSYAKAILHSSVDFLLLILIALFLFTVSSSAAGKYIDQISSPSTLTVNSKTKHSTSSVISVLLSRIGAVAAPIFPLILFVYSAIHYLFVPWSNAKQQFWSIISYTVLTPLYVVNFRDGLVGDIITSVVRPLQDAIFTIAYLLCGLRGWWRYNTTPDAIQTELLNASAMESSWVMHTLLLPTCIVSPLWWRFIQTLRQVYQFRKRWPYLGNSGKYFCAAQVAILGMWYPGFRSTWYGISSFIFVTLYQVYWDIFMDWELLVWDHSETSFRHGRRNRFNRRLKLREKRIFQYEFTYYFILTVNVLLRFCWSMTFIPSRYLNRTSGILMYTFSADFSTFKGPALASAEIIRRTLWAVLRVELEVLKVTGQWSSSSPARDDVDHISSNLVYRADEMKPMPTSLSTTRYHGNAASFLKSALKSMNTCVPRGSLALSSDAQVIKELMIYVTIFVGIGIIAVVHRGVM